MAEFHVPQEETILPAPETPVETSPDRLGTILLRLRNRHEIAGDPPEVPPPIQIEQLAQERVEAQPEKPVHVPDMVTIEKVPDEPEEHALHEASKRLQEVYKSAEQNEPIEAVLEQSHEVRHEPDVHERPDVAAAVSKVLAELHQKTAAAHKAFSQFAAQLPSVKLPAPKIFASLPALYKKAVVLGFSMALVILVGLSLFS